MKESLFKRMGYGWFCGRKRLRLIRNSFVRQRGMQDCGPACLLGLLKYYGVDAAEAELAERLGMGRTGTSVLALLEAAESAGFRVKAFRAELPDPAFLKNPSILYYQRDGKGHFVIIYGQGRRKSSDLFMVGDPARGLAECSLEKIVAFGADKILLTIQPETGSGYFADPGGGVKHWFGLHIKARRDTWLVSLLLSAGLAGLGLSVALSVQHIVSLMLGNPHGDGMYTSVTALFFLMLMRALVQYFRELFFIRYTYDHNRELLGSFIGQLLDRPKRFFRAHTFGDLMLRLTDLATLQHNTAILSNMLVLDAVMLVFYSGFLMHYSLMIGFIVLACLSLAWMLSLHFASGLFLLRKRMMESHISAYGRFADTIQGIQSLLDTGVQRIFSIHIIRTFRIFYGHSAAFRRMAVRLSFAGELSGVLLYGLSFFYALRLIRLDELTVPEFIGMLMLLNPVMTIMHRMGYLQSQWTETGTAFGRTRLGGTEKKPEPGQALSEIRELTVRQISFGFPGRKLLIRTATLTLRKGELVQLHGANGTGKSTLLQLIMGDYPLNSGGIYVNEYPREMYAPDELRRKIGLVPQEGSLFDASLRDNISLYRLDGPFGRVEDLLTGTGMDALFTGMMPVLDTMLGPEGQKLSGGQRQLILLARALYTDPDILLFDEPLNALDISHSEEYIRVIQTLRRSKGILVIHHGRDGCFQPDRVYRLKGRFLLSEQVF